MQSNSETGQPQHPAAAVVTFVGSFNSTAPGLPAGREDLTPVDYHVSGQYDVMLTEVGGLALTR